MNLRLCLEIYREGTGGFIMAFHMGDCMLDSFESYRRIAFFYEYSVEETGDVEAPYVASVKEYPSLMAHGRSRQEALMELAVVVEDVIEDLLADGDEPLAPIMLARS